jgi:hypothetical protein
VSKIVPLAGLSLIQCLLLVASVSILADFPGDFYERVATLFLAALAASTMGLTVSAFVNSNDKAVALVPMLLIPQVILSGAIVDLTAATEIFAKVTMISYWGFDAMKVTLENSPPGVVTSQYELWFSLSMISMLCLAFLVTSFMGLLVKDRSI